MADLWAQIDDRQDIFCCFYFIEFMEKLFSIACQVKLIRVHLYYFLMQNNIKIIG